MNNFYYLSHGGPGSGRYPLGSGERPYQGSERSRRKYGISGYMRAKKNEKKVASNIRKAQEREKFLADKERVLKSGSAYEVSKYKGELTKQELQDAYKRLNLEQQINKMASTEILDNQKLVNNVLANVKKTSEWIATGAASYNVLASVYNGIVDDSRKLPTIRILR